MPTLFYDPDTGRLAGVLLDDGTAVPKDDANRFWRDFAAGPGAGMDLSDRPPPTLEELVSRVRDWASALADSGDPARVLLRALLRLMMGAHAQERAYLELLRQQVVALGGTLPPAPGVRTWDELVAEAKALIASGAGDAPPPA